jgi:hypothetical protein
MKLEIQIIKSYRQIFGAAILIVLGLSISVGRAQFFTSGDLIVLQDGAGSAALSSAGTAIFLDQFTTGGVFVNDVAIPTSGSLALVNSGTAGSEGQLSLSQNNQYVILAGYNADAGTAGVASSTTIPRGVGTVDANGNYSLAATTTTFYNGNNIRGGTSDGLGNFWGAGAAATGGTVYLGTGTPSQVTSSNSLAIQAIAGNLYFSSAKGTSGIYEIFGTPISGPAVPSLLIATGANPSDFTFNANMTIAYVANTGSGINGGISRYNFIGGVWTLAYTLDSNTAMNAVVANFSGANPVIYATTESGANLVEITDAGAGTTSGATILDTAGTDEAFRGLTFAPDPVPEPSDFALGGFGLAALIGFRRIKNHRQ